MYKPLSLAFARQLPYRGEPLAKREGFPECQGLSSIGEVAAAPPLPEGVSPPHLKVMSEKTGFAARSFLMPCRHSGRSPVPTRSHFLQAEACPRRENRKQDVSCRPACTKKSRLPAALHAVSIAHRSVPFHAILRRRRSRGTSGTTGTAFFQKHLNTPIYRICHVLYALI